MSLNPNLFVPLFQIQEGLLDKTSGLQLSAGYVYTWQDLNRNNQKPLYEITGSPPNYTYTPLSNPIILTNAGTFADTSGNDIVPYLYPYTLAGAPDNYYFQVFSAASLPFPPPVLPLGTPEFTRENVPGILASGTIPMPGPQSTENVLTNPQFAQVYFNPAVGMTIPYTASANQLTNIAPGWVLSITASGTGNVTVTRTSVAGSAAQATNTPYYLTITGQANISSLILYQRLYNNTNIFASDNVPAGGITGLNFIAAGIALAPISQTVSMYYAPQGTPVATTTAPYLLSTNNPNGLWEYFTLTSQMAVAENTFTADAGFVDIQVVLTPSATTSISSVQIVGLSSLTQQIPFDQQPVNRQIDYEFHVQQASLAYSPIPSYLVGWDFPLNPAQINGSTVAAVNTGPNLGYYVWDQTILFQTTTSSTAAARAATGALQLTCGVAGPCQIALIQYLDSVQALKIINDRASVHISGSTTHAGGLSGNVTLWATTNANLPNVAIGTGNTLITALSATGIPTAAAGWVQIPNVYQNTSFTLQAASATNSESADINLNGWDLQGAAPASTATYFAIVVGFSPWINTDTITLNSIGLCAGDIATRPAPKTQDEVLRDCERWYEKSYGLNVLPGTITTFGALSAPGSSSNYNAGPGGTTTYTLESSFTFTFRTQKRLPTTAGAPTVSIYSPATGTVARVREFAQGSALNQTDVNINVWNTTYISDKFATYIVTGNAGNFYAPLANTALNVWITYHYVADARLGIVN
jgi:hypothetical protein